MENSMKYNDIYNKWLYSGKLDDSMKSQLERMTEEEIEDAFHQDLTFGTGGMRGIMGPGTNRMNIFTQRRVNQAFAQYIESCGEEAKRRGVVIAYDCRYGSEEFSKTASAILAENGIKVYRFESLRPTPELSFAVRRLNAFGGIVITASHNPPNYNGYKCYGEDGCQLNDHKVKTIIDNFNAITDPFQIECMEYFDALKTGLVEEIGSKIDDEFVETVLQSQINPDLEKNIKVVFSAMHGTSANFGPRVLSEAGYDVTPVESQQVADPEFSTVESPNPEDEKAFKLSEELGKEIGADILIATDPDADRVRIGVKDGAGYYYLTGNETAGLFTKYICEQLTIKSEFPANPIFFDTVVSSRFAATIAESYGCKVVSTLTGFKNIGTAVADYCDAQGFDYILGYEESIGYVVKPYVRDKDSITAALLAAEIAQYYVNKGLSLKEQLFALYKEYGFFIDGGKSIVMPGIEGAKKIKAGVEYFRTNRPQEVLGLKVIQVEDFGTQTVYVNGTEHKHDYDKSNFLKYTLEDGSWFVIRPSGTEPKLKIYIGVKENTLVSGFEKEKAIMDYVQNTLNNI